MDNIHVVKETTLTVEKKPLVLVLPYLDSVSLQTPNHLKYKASSPSGMSWLDGTVKRSCLAAPFARSLYV